MLITDRKACFGDSIWNSESDIAIVEARYGIWCLAWPAGLPAKNRTTVRCILAPSFFGCIVPFSKSWSFDLLSHCLNTYTSVTNALSTAVEQTYLSEPSRDTPPDKIVACISHPSVHASVDICHVARWQDNRWSLGACIPKEGKRAMGRRKAGWTDEIKKLARLT